MAFYPFFFFFLVERNFLFPKYTILEDYENGGFQPKFQSWHRQLQRLAQLTQLLIFLPPKLIRFMSLGDATSISHKKLQFRPLDYIYKLGKQFFK